jgi:hypothetical protein
VYGDKLNMTGGRSSNRNELTIARVRSLDDVRSLTPCTVTVTHEEIRKKSFKIEVHESCRSIYFMLPPYTSISDVFTLAETLMKRDPDPREFVFVVNEISLYVRELFLKQFPGNRLIILGDSVQT